MFFRSELFVAILFLIGKCLSNPSIPCPSTFKYESLGNTNYGIITIDRVHYGETLVEIEISQSGYINSEYSGSLQLNFDKDKIFEYIDSGQPVTYKVNFPTDVVPQVSSIRVNGNTICSGSTVPAPSTIVTLKHTITATNSKSTAPSQASEPSRPKFDWSPPPSQNLPWLSRATSTSRPFFGFQHFLNSKTTSPQEVSSFHNNPFLNNRNHFASTIKAETYGSNNTPSFMKFRTSPSSYATDSTYSSRPFPSFRTSPSENLPQSNNPISNDYINSICGQENTIFGFNKLAVNGERIAKTRFPWIAAIYKKHIGTLSFQCGGSLISRRTVISAAHCFYTGFDVIKDEDILVSLGRHNLTDWSDNFIVQSDVDAIIRHPDYRPELENIDADLAIVRLKKIVTFSLAIRPICMWDERIDVRDIEGTSGIVVGWGRDGVHSLTTSPRLVTANIVSDETCTKSNPKLKSLTSSRTLCAGNRDGTGPCNGDSGSGLMIKHNNKWLLRGTVSAALGDDVGNCDLFEYVVYTDTAKFSGWIQSNTV